MDKDEFLKKYKLQETFENSGLDWEILEAIYYDYSKRIKELKKEQRIIVERIEDGLEEDCVQIHSVRGRTKDAEHLLEKIIRKRGEEQAAKYSGINVSNYREIIRDLIGIRILVLKKEDWEDVHEWICGFFPKGYDLDTCMVERPIAYIRYGDRDIFKEKIKKEYSIQGYRSQHYIVKYMGYFCEIQVRTLAEEVYGEFDHEVRYPYDNNNSFLRSYTLSISQFLDSVDEMISICFRMGKNLWDICKESFNEDTYFDWTHIDQSSQRNDWIKNLSINSGGKIEIKEYADIFFLRKEQ